MVHIRIAYGIGLGSHNSLHHASPVALAFQAVLDVGGPLPFHRVIVRYQLKRGGCLLTPITFLFCNHVPSVGNKVTRICIEVTCIRGEVTRICSLLRWPLCRCRFSNSLGINFRPLDAAGLAHFQIRHADGGCLAGFPVGEVGGAVLLDPVHGVAGTRLEAADFTRR